MTGLAEARGGVRLGGGDCLVSPPRDGRPREELLLPDDLGPDERGPDDLDPDDLGPEDLVPEDRCPDGRDPEDLRPPVRRLSAG